MTNQLPSPSVLLGIPSYGSWRVNQDTAFQTVMDWYSSDLRYLGLSAATGSGKSLIALLTAKMTGARTIILTATKGLQEQYSLVGSQLGLVSVKGQNNFTCQLVPGLRADEGPCHEGLACEYRTNGCRYREQLNKALSSQLIVTNYSYYLAQTKFSSGLGDVDLLIADEAHLAFQAVENFLQIHLSRQETESLGLEFPRGQQDWSYWQAWASANLDTVSEAAKDMEAQVKSARQNGDFVPSSQSRILRSYRATTHHLQAMSTATGKWVVQAYPHGWQFTPVWIKDYNQLLPQSSPKMLLMSALLSEKTLDILGIPAAERKFFSIGSSFPPQNTPIWHIPTARINYQTDNSGTAIWLARIDQIISRRLDRKGIIFTVSYARRDLILRRSQYAGIMMSHSTRDVVEMVRRFREAPAPCVFVSPSITSGYDVPEADYIIIGKIPYPDTTDLVLKARQEDDDTWSSYLAMDTLVNEAGRGTRSSTDRTEVFLVDDNFLWFNKKFKTFAPVWFQQRVRGTLSLVPDPLFTINNKS
jgi:Rad3-related DNA helicase